jgi:hypothetical protein
MIETSANAKASSDLEETKMSARIGLCMIVKDEAHVIRRCLDSVRPLVDYVLVEDTGSTDGTQDIIRAWLQEHGIAGEVVEEAWRDFAFNRTHALSCLRRHADIDYALIIDADDTLEYEPGFDPAAFKASMSADLYDVVIHDNGILYSRPQLIRNARHFSYRGVLHEFIEGPPDAQGRATAEQFSMRRGGDGARSQDPEKFVRDARILAQALAEESDPFLRSRYTFYLAQSYRDCGEREKALEHYLARGQMGFWQEEVFVALYRAAQLKEALGHPEEEVIAAYLRASEAQPARAEALHGASRFCRYKGRNKEGAEIARRGIDLPMPGSGLFIEPWIYQWRLLDEFAINAYWSGDHQGCLDASLRMLATEALDEATRRRATANARFASDRLREGLAVMRQEMATAQIEHAKASTSSAMPRILLAILAKNKEGHLPLFLSCIEALDYPTDRISLYVRTNNNTDSTAKILGEWLDRVGNRYFHVEFDDNDVPERVQDFGEHEWNVVRFSVLGRLRQLSMTRTRERGCDFYFVVDVDNFIRPPTLRNLVSLNLPIVAPLLKCADPASPFYSNFHHGVDLNGYYRATPEYYAILSQNSPGIHDVAVVHCTYLVRADVISKLTYDDGSQRYEYVIFSDSARRAGIPHTREVYGWLTFAADDAPARHLMADALSGSINGRMEAHNISDGHLASDSSCVATTAPGGAVYVINLDKDTQRLAEFERRNGHLSEVKRFSAVNGNLANREELLSEGIISSPLSYKNGTLGCALSHVRLWQTAVSENTPLTIFEDDVFSRVDFCNQQRAVLNSLPPEWDIILWGYIYNPLFVWLDFDFAKAELRPYDRKIPADFFSIRRGDLAVRPIKLAHAFGLLSYSISPKGASLMLKGCLPLRDRLIDFPGAGIVINDEGIDCTLQAVYPSVNAYCCVPPLAVHMDEVESTRKTMDVRQ